MKHVRWFRNAAWGGGWELDLLFMGWELRIARHQIALWKDYTPVFNFLDHDGVRRKALRLAFVLLALAASCAGAPAFAQEPAPSPAAPLSWAAYSFLEDATFQLRAAQAGVVPDPAVATPPTSLEAVRFGFSTYTAIALGRPDTKVRYLIQGDVQGPLVVGSKAWGDLGGSASIETLPAKQDAPDGSVTDLASWGNVVSLSGWAGKRIGDAAFGTQSISTSLVLEGDIATALFDSTAEPLRKRFYRGFGAGVQFTLHLPDRDAYARIGWGRDEAVGPFGKGQLRLSGELPLPALKGARLKVKGGLGLGALSKDGEQTDYFLIAIGKPW